MQSIIGWDIGGAHVKAARIENQKIVRVLQLPSRLWLGLDQLDQAIAEAQLQLGKADQHVATMTGELSDLFANRAEGVASLAEALTSRLRPLLFYGGRAGWLEPHAVPEHASEVASANWHASATLAGRCLADALFVDMGSTTTDIVPICEGRPHRCGYTDSERLQTGSLVYTGFIRSFVMALAPRAPFAGQWTSLACEHFATTADVYRLLGALTEAADQMPTADGRDKSLAASRARLARMVGHDAADADDSAWQGLAAWLAEAQLRQIEDAAMMLISGATVTASAKVISAGVGHPVVKRLAERLGRPCVGFGDLLGASAIAWSEECAPAVSVGLLAASQRW